ncbi:MAG: cupin domain-containing protein [Lentisphaeria bacterium]|nr:cupin domain-containing protein [Lentisphaeria bacterium]
MMYSKETGSLIYDQEGSTGHSLAQVGDLEYVELVLAPGCRIERHALPFAIEFYVVEGKGDLLLAEQTMEVDARQLVHIDAGEERGWVNTGERNLVILGVKHTL